jgi:hypothetical protein
VAVAGKTLRGAGGASADGRPVHLLAAMDHTTRQVLAQASGRRRARRGPRLPLLLDGLDLDGVVVTADAL